MHAHTARSVSLALLAILVALSTGCSGGGSAPSTPTITGEPTATAPATVAPAAGPITTPAAGSALRAELLEAASLGLGVSDRFTVYQLFVQDGAAVGDVLPAGGSRTLFALSGGPDSWELVWSARFGSTQANADALKDVGPEVFAGLAASLDFAKKAPSTAPKPSAKPAVAPTLASFEAFALKSAKSFAGATYAGPFTIQARIAKDSKGAWWGNAVAEPAEAGLEPIGVWARYSGGAWTGEIADFSTEGADAGFFPSDVLAKLEL